MWQDKVNDIHARRAVLLARSHALREHLAEASVGLERPFALADMARDQVRWWSARPMLLAAVAAVPLVLRPARLVTWSLKLWSGWRLWKQVQRALLR